MRAETRRRDAREHSLVIERPVSVRDLRERLEVLEEAGYADAPVVLSKDGEGNLFSPLDGDAGLDRYRWQEHPGAPWFGDCVDDDDAPDAPVVITLWPVC